MGVAEQATALRLALEGIRAAELERDPTVPTRWTFIRVTPDWRQRAWTWDGDVDERRWAESVHGFPNSYDSIQLAAGTWGDLQLRALSFGNSPVTLSLQAEVGDEAVTDHATVLLDVLQAAAEREVHTGFVHLDAIADPYSTVMVTMGDGDFAEFVHGYYWAVLLTEAHLERLGGVDRVREEAPCAAVLAVPGRPNRLLCVLTPSPLDLDAEIVQRWRAFLGPVLRPGYPEGWDRLRSHTAPWDRPMWLFEGAPVPLSTRFILHGGQDADGRMVPVSWAADVHDPEAPTLWIYPGTGLDPAVHGPVVQAVIGAWALAGLAGELAGQDGSFAAASAATWDTDDDECPALAIQVDFGSCSADTAKLLSAALSELNAVEGGEVIANIVIR